MQSCDHMKLVHLIFSIMTQINFKTSFHIFSHVLNSVFDTMYELFQAFDLSTVLPSDCWQLGLFLFPLHCTSYHSASLPFSKNMLLFLVCHLLFFLPTWAYTFMIAFLLPLSGTSGKSIKGRSSYLSEISELNVQI